MEIAVSISDPPGKSTRAWVLRPLVWFPTACTLITIIHETGHAVTGVALGIPSTLFNFWVNHDFSHATAAERALVGIAGPTVSLLVGLVCWFIYRRVRTLPAGLPLLYLAAGGVANFCGNLMSASFVGDFSAAALVLGTPPAARYAASITGALATIAILVATGRELRRWMPGDKTTAILGGIVVPAIVGTVFIIVLNQPTPMGRSFAPARAVEGSLWIIAALGAWLSNHDQEPAARLLRIHWLDVTVAAAAILAVRTMAHGISLTP